jgi:hypothetical protein
MKRRGVMFVRIVSTAMLLVALASCATTANYELMLNTWIGAPESALIGGFGIPDKTYELPDGSKVIEYERRGNMT